MKRIILFPYSARFIFRQWLKCIIRMVVINWLCLSTAFSATEDKMDLVYLENVKLIEESWKALYDKRYPDGIVYTRDFIAIYAQEARRINQLIDKNPHYCSLSEKCIILNDVTMAYFIRAETYLQMREYQKSKEAFETLLRDYNHGRNWDPQGWYWDIQQTAQEKIAYLNNKLSGRDPYCAGIRGVLKIKFLENGEIYADDHKVTLRELRQRLRKLKKDKGGVWYYIENRGRDLSRSEKKVLSWIKKYAIPRSETSKDDFTDYLEDDEFFPRKL